jgi:DNA invertase Pin-like site-specific DNA recombinase
MPKSAKDVSMKVPEDMLEQMQAYMERLKLSTSVIPSVLKETVSKETECEVSKIHNHRISIDGDWQFEVGWKGFRTREWVNDVDCKCEMEIANYLREKNIRTAYLFCRVSTAEQATAVNVSLKAQESELRFAVSSLPEFTRFRVYSISKSAYKNIPSVLSQIGNACLPGDGIFVWRVDRLSRNIVKYLGWLEDLNDRGVLIYSHQEKLIYSENKLDFLQAVLDAQKEASLLGERVKMSYKLKRQRGDEKVGNLPYGKKYFRVLSTYNPLETLKKTVVDNPDEMSIIDRIKAKNTKFDPALMAEQLNSEGLKKRGRKWNKLSVLRVYRQK